jgi:hypothetical protein
MRTVGRLWLVNENYDSRWGERYGLWRRGATAVIQSES